MDVAVGLTGLDQGADGGARAGFGVRVERGGAEGGGGGFDGAVGGGGLDDVGEEAGQFA